MTITFTPEEEKELDRARGRFSPKAYLLMQIRRTNKRKAKSAEETAKLPEPIRKKMTELWGIFLASYKEIRGEDYVSDDARNGKRPPDIEALEKYARMNVPNEEFEKRVRRYCQSGDAFLVKSGHRFYFFKWNCYSEHKGAVVPTMGLVERHLRGTDARTT